MTKRDLERYQAAVKYVESLGNIHNPYQYEKTHSQRERFLKRTQKLLDLIGNPERGLKVVHITGTSGKGSVSKLTQLMLGEAGHKTGLFTSPFATTSVEKIQINDKYMSAKEFADAMDIIKPALDKMAVDSIYGLPAYFEIFFAIAVLHFKKQKCEWAVIEVGMGGRYDATNIFPRPQATAITMIDYDHTHLLGRTLDKIAWEKMGIIKKGSNFFTTEQRPALVKKFHQECKKVGATFYHLALPKSASHHDANLALSATIAESLGVTEKQINKASSLPALPCRFELIQRNPRVILDGAHNPSKMRATAHDLNKLNYKKLHVIFALGQTKDLGDIATSILPQADFIYATRYFVDKSCTHPKEIATWAKKHSKAKIQVMLDPWAALDQALELAKKDDLILVTGSFYLAGELRKRWYPEEWVLSHLKSFK